jgi:hypothetical protein
MRKYGGWRFTDACIDAFGDGRGAAQSAAPGQDSIAREVDWGLGGDAPSGSARSDRRLAPVPCETQR